MNDSPWLIPLGLAALLFWVLFIAERIKAKSLKAQWIQKDADLKAAMDQVHLIRDGATATLVQIQKLADVQLAEMNEEKERVRLHYETEAKKAQDAADELLANTLKELEPLRRFASVAGAEAETQRLLADAIKEASSLRIEAHAMMDRTRSAAAAEKVEATKKVAELRLQADAILDQATRDAARIIKDAHQNAKTIAGDAYVALRDKEKLEQAAKAISNIIYGYGDRYIVPTKSVVDDLASDFGHTEAGRSLLAAREQSRRIVEEGHAADCDYAEANRRETAIRFVVDAFNGRVDGILTRTKNDNFGTLQQEIKDAFSMVNLNGKAFRDARILPSYLDARLSELKWAVAAQELKMKEREEQRRIKEQIREEEKVRREYERVMKEAEQEEAVIKRALEKARLEVDKASVEQRAKFEQQINQLNQRLMEAEAKNQRALSMAQQTRKGNVYIISNTGSFGEDVFKIGMTRRLDPMDRIYELSDASVPFDFDVHAMIACDDAPALEYLLHTEFDDNRINKVNYRKEFFRVPLERVRAVITGRGIQATFTLLAEAHEYRETQVLNKMTPEERENYIVNNPAKPLAEKIHENVLAVE